jgi:hypothetical protein
MATNAAERLALERELVEEQHTKNFLPGGPRWKPTSNDNTSATSNTNENKSDNGKHNRQRQRQTRGRRPEQSMMARISCRSKFTQRQRHTF